MKIIVSTTAPELDSPMDPNFGRSAYFVTVDSHTLEWQAHPNPAAADPGGAGVRAAQFVSGHQAQGVISGDFGPKAHQALLSAGVQMFRAAPGLTARQAVARFEAGELVPLSVPGGRANKPGG